MSIDKKTHTLLRRLPLIGVLGVNSDFSRYKYLIRLTDELRFKENFVNQYLKDKVNILVYPKKYGENRYIKVDEDYIEIKNLKKAITEYKNAIEAIILPGHCLDKDCIFEIPGQWDRDYEFIFGNSIYQVIFVEAFPYGKENFIHLLDDATHEYSFSLSKKVLFYKANVQYGATDVSLLDDAIDSAVLKIKEYVQSWSVFDDTSEKYKLCESEFDLSAQFKKKKHIQIEKMKKVFETEFEKDYLNEATRFLNVGFYGDERNGILSEQSFQKASDFENVKGSDDVENRILSNYLSILKHSGKSIVKLARELYCIYLNEFINIELFEFDKFEKQTISAIENNYKLSKKRACPSKSYEYMILCSKEDYIVKLKKCVNQSIEENVHLKIKDDIKQKLEECEEKYI